MRPVISRAARAGSSLGDAAAPTFVCRNCLTRSIHARAGAGASQGQKRFYAEQQKPKKKRGGITDSEAWRKRIWGTDQPPGSKDPYTQSQFAPEYATPAEWEGAEDEVIPYEGATIEEAQAYDSDYEQAKDGTGLRKIGGRTVTWEKIWDEKHQFSRWAPPTIQNLQPKQASQLIHRAYVEVIVLHRNGLQVNDVCHIPEMEHIDYDAITAAKRSKGKVHLQFPDVAWEQQIIDSLLAEPVEVADEMDAEEGESAEELSAQRAESSEEASAATGESAANLDEETAASESQEEPSAEPEDPATQSVAQLEKKDHDWTADKKWRNLAVLDDFKFALLKRVMQLTGKRFPDYAIRNTRDLGRLLDTITKYKAPAKLADELLDVPATVKPMGSWPIAPNVTVHRRRHTWVKREQSLGRYKKIYSELKVRGLPLPRRKANAY